MLLQPQRHWTSTCETVNMEEPHSSSSSSSSSSLRRTRSPEEHLDSNINNSTVSAAASAVVGAIDANDDEEERLRYIMNQLNEKQVPSISHHGLTILITGANRYVLYCPFWKRIFVDE